MKEAMSKSTGVFVILLFCAAAATTASSQSRSKTTSKPSSADVVTPIDKKTVTERNKAIEAARSTDAEPASNEIRCRGFPGVGMFTAENSKLNSTGETIVTMLLTSAPSPYAAGLRGEGLRPGECSWVDRPIDVRNVDERYFLIRFESPANAQLKQRLHGSQVDTSPTAAERFPDAQTIPAYMYDPKHYWSFFGVTRVNNSYAAAGHKYWKPPLKLIPHDSIRLKKDNPDVSSPKKPE